MIPLAALAAADLAAADAAAAVNVAAEVGFAGCNRPRALLAEVVRTAEVVAAEAKTHNHLCAPDQALDHPLQESWLRILALQFLLGVAVLPVLAPGPVPGPLHPSLSAVVAAGRASAGGTSCISP